MPLPDLPSLGETVRRHGLRADKSLGQHFLLDPSITDRIASLCDLGGDLGGDLPATVLEVGPGPGGLTRSLLAAGAERVVAVEMDTRFLPALAEVAEATGRLEVVEGDALEVDLRDRLPDGFVVASNLPYNVGTKLLTNWLTDEPRRWRQLVLMFQREVAERVVAEPGTGAYGRLAVLSRSVCECHIAFGIPPGAFSPPPKVSSAVVVLRPLSEPFGDLAGLEQVTRAAFGQRRKMLRAALRGMAKGAGVSAEAWLEASGLEPTARAETVPVEGFQRLVQTWRGMAG